MKKLLLIMLFPYLVSLSLYAQCPGNPGFTWNQICKTLTVQFTNTSTVQSPKQIDSLSWNFGDGSPILKGKPATVGSPSYTYLTSGTYNVTIGIKILPDNCWKYESKNVTVNPIPDAQFTFSPNNACSPVTVNFLNSSVGNGLTYQWDFGDGSPTSNAQNPSHAYNSFGSGTQNYNVRLIITDNKDCKDTSYQVVTVKQRPNIDFFDSRNWKHCAYGVIAKDTLIFQNISPGASDVASYYIQWGDGKDTTVVSFTSLTHVYTGMNNYNIQVTATGLNGCTSTWTVTLVVDQTPVAGITPPTPGSNQGCAPLTLSIGNNSTYNPATTSVTILWGDGQQTNLPLGTSPGGSYQHTYTSGNCGAPPSQHTITLRATNACNTSIATYCCVDVNIPPQAFFTHTTPTCINQPITFYNYSSRNVCASNPNSRYKWNFGDGTVIPFTLVNNSNSPQQVVTHTYTTPGTYVVRLTAYNPSPLGCDSTVFQRTIVIGDMFPNFVSDTACQGQQLTHLSSTSRDTIINIVSYQWTFSSASPSTASGPNVTTTYTAGGNQSATLTVTANNGCTKSITKPVYVWRLPNPNFTYTNKCQYEYIPFTDQSTRSLDNHPLVSWYWNFDDGTFSTQQNPQHLFPTHGEYRVTLRVTDSKGCYRTSNYKSVLVYPKPTANFTNTLACESLMVNYTNQSRSPCGLQHHYFTNSCSYCCGIGCSNFCWASYPTGSYACNTPCTGSGWWFWNTVLSYEWDFGDGSPVSNLANPTHFYSPPGNYTNRLIVTNIYGCKDTIQKVLTVHINPSANFRADTVCFRDTTRFTNLSVTNGGTPLSSYLWNFGDATTSTQTNPKKRYSNPGTYNVRLITTNQVGCKDTIFKSVRVWRLPIDSFKVNNVCLFDTLKPINNSQPTDANLSLWIWNYGDGTVDSAYTSSHVYNSTGLYNVNFTVVDSNNCRSTKTKQVRVYALPVANFGFSAGCMGYGVNFYDSSTIASPNINGNITSWYWNFGDTRDTFAQSPVHVYNDIGTYTIQLIVTTSRGCKDTAYKNIQVYVPPVAFFRYDTVCFKNPTPFFDQSTPMPAPIINWNWNFGDGNTASVQNPQHVFTRPGVFNTTLTVRDTNGCHHQITRLVRVDSLPKLNFLANNVCFGDTVDILNFSTPTQGSPIISWWWDFGDGTVDSIQHPSPHFYSNDSTYIITLIAKNDLNCVDTLKKAVQVYTLPTANFTAALACQKQPVNFVDQSFNPIASIVGWNWNFGDNTTSTIKNPVHVYPYPGDTVYQVTLIVRDNHNCRDTIQKTIKLNPKPRAGFFANVACNRDTTFFVDTSWAGGPISSWLWNFGDGVGTANVQNPTYIYPVINVPTTYNVRLIVIDNNNCKDTITKPVLVNPQPIASFFADSACYGFPNHLNDLSTSTGGAIVQRYWDFGDGVGTGSNANEVYTYSQPCLLYTS
ncbi:MAG: PKD domain-containing protein, partial [Bacteroidales bacterium]|nr:PKD domain-containing protein [Bacteroidales bacterium]